MGEAADTPEGDGWGGAEGLEVHCTMASPAGMGTSRTAGRRGEKLETFTTSMNLQESVTSTLRQETQDGWMEDGWTEVM